MAATPATRLRMALTTLAVLSVGTMVAAPAVALPADVGVVTPAVTELLSNGGLESGFAGWTVDREATLVRYSHTGRAAARLVTDQPGTATMSGTSSAVSSSTGATTYRASVWVRSEAPGAGARLTVHEVSPDNDSASGGTHSVVVVLEDTEWHRVSVDLDADQGQSFAVEVQVRTAGIATGVLVDDMSLALRGVDAVRPDSGETCAISGFTAYAEPGETWQQAVARRDADYGRAPVLRVFYPGLPQDWPGRAGLANRDVVVSFKANPTLVLSGALDQRLSGWFAAAPTDHNVYWSYFHEPEDQIEDGTFTAEQYRAAWRHLADLADAARAGRPDNLHATLVLMAWSLTPASGRTWSDYYPGDDTIDVLGWDAYNLGATAATPRYRDPAQVFGPAAAISLAHGKPFGFAEWGSLLIPGDDGTARAAWITAAAHEQARLGAIFSTYFDARHRGDYRLTDPASRAALRSVITC